jgi:uncharacterized protein (TIGR02646 family)
MRNISKLPEPQILIEKQAEWMGLLLGEQSETNKNRYRHEEIKTTLLSETKNKCAYCESKIGHNCPGDIEHKVPKALNPNLTFNWDNMTIACTECNRRKSQYYDPSCMFLDPNSDDVERMVQHVGPLVFSSPGNKRADVTIRLLQLDSADAREQLFGRKLERLENIRNLVERIVSETNKTLKGFLFSELNEYCDISSEYSGMIKAYVEGLPNNWSSI